MTFDESLAQTLDLLQRQGRVSYRALKRRFVLDDDYLEDLKAELIDAQRVAAIGSIPRPRPSSIASSTYFAAIVYQHFQEE